MEFIINHKCIVTHLRVTKNIIYIILSYYLLKRDTKSRNGYNISVNKVPNK